MYASPSKRAERFPWRSQCEFAINGRRQVGVVINISKTGLFVQAATAQAHRGSLVTLTIQASEKHPAIVLQACVARKQLGSAGLAGGGASGLGLQIVESSAPFEAVLQHCAALRHGDSIPCNPYDVPYTAPSAEDVLGVASAHASLFRVRVMLRGTTRSRMLTVRSASADEARQKARAQVHDDWKIIEVSPRCS